MGPLASGAAAAPSPDSQLFDAQEIALFAEGLGHLGRASPHDAEFMREQLRNLTELGRVIAAMPSLRQARTLRGSTRDAETLASYLARTNGEASELTLPLRAVVSRTFVVAKIHLLRAFSVACGEGAPGAHPALAARFTEELGQSIYTYLAEEILVSLLGVPDLPLDTKQHAAEQLLALWEDAPMLEVDDFCPLLESAWRARARCQSGLGAMLGTAEYFRLVQAECSEDFLSFFTREDVSEEENQAFEEFLFGLPFEDLELLRAEMRARGLAVIDHATAAQVLGLPVEELAVVDDPYALYRSFCRRRVAAEFRVLARRPGPRRVAEASLMIRLLEQQGMARRR